MYLTGLARVARDAGITVREVPGWTTRTAHAGGMTKVHGVIWHHTASPANLVTTRNNPTLNYMINGLGYPLANYGLAWDGSLDVIAAGTGAHAGKGSYRGVPNNDGNRHMIGIEVEGTIGLAWSPAQLETAARLGAQLNRDFGSNLLHIGHLEWAPGRKTDPSGIPGGMNALRAAIQRGHWATPVKLAAPVKAEPAPAKTPTPAPVKDWFTMATEADLRKIVREEAAKAVWNHELTLPRSNGAKTTAGAIQASDYVNNRESYALAKEIARELGMSETRILEAIQNAERNIGAAVEKQEA